MTNREKFKEVFGFVLEADPCIITHDECQEHECRDCPYASWWDTDYQKGGNYDKP